MDAECPTADVQPTLDDEATPFMRVFNAFMPVNAFMQAASSLQPSGVVWDLQYALY